VIWLTFLVVGLIATRRMIATGVPPEIQQRAYCWFCVVALAVAAVAFALDLRDDAARIDLESSHAKRPAVVSVLAAGILLVFVGAGMPLAIWSSRADGFLPFTGFFGLMKGVLELILNTGLLLACYLLILLRFAHRNARKRAD
jgi:hypothetical protein